VKYIDRRDVGMSISISLSENCFRPIQRESFWKKK